MDNPETLATFDTQVTERRQTKTKKQLRKSQFGKVCGIDFTFVCLYCNVELFTQCGIFSTI